MPEWDKDLAALRICGENPELAENAERLHRALRHKSCYVVERAAQIIAEHPEKEFVNSLLDAHARFLGDPLKTDPGCIATTAICSALWQVGCTDADFFLMGIRYVQAEPIHVPPWQIDGAAEYRAICGFALVDSSHPDAIRHLVDLLVDPEPAARAGAARAIAWASRVESAPLLRLKVHAGDDRPEVLGECFSGLLKLDPAASFPLVVKHLSTDDEEVFHEAAIALGESQHADALDALINVTSRDQQPNLQRVALMAIGLIHNAAAAEFLISLVSPQNPLVAIVAIEALAHHRDYRNVQPRLAELVRQYDNRQIAEAFQQAFCAT